ncbi:MAG: DNA polymerase III subunit beta [Acetatifactor muris]|nr:DNA polymerase III subunit beta [Acetatifactor muris]MCM1525636.1 DNA polymerase III subunit beta [Bacteroides sp.]
MKLICSKSNLLNGVQTVSKAVPNKTTMSILECILVDATQGVIKLTANDMELGIETIVEGEIVEKGIVALEAKMFLEIVRKFPDSDIVIETDGSYKTSIICEKSKFNIIGKSGEDFSYLPVIERDYNIVISQFTLKEVVRQTIFSISDNDNNKLMTGELFDINENEFKVVSLDGHRISIRKIELKNHYEPKKVVVPGKTLNEVSKILSGDADKDVTLYFTPKHIIFEFDNTTVVSRLIEGEYFKIDQMLSSDYETKVKINKKEFLNCIDRATLLVKEGDKKPIIINITEEGMELKINSVLGSMNEEIDIEMSGKNLMIGFNPKFLIDALRVIDDEEVELYMVNPKAPCFIKNSEESYIYLILPVNFTTVN